MILSRSILIITIVSLLIIVFVTNLNTTKVTSQPPPLPMKSYRRLGIRVIAIREGVINKVVFVQGSSVTIYENVQYIVGKIVDAIEIPENVPIDIEWKKCKRAEDLIGENVTVWFMGRYKGVITYMEFRGYLCDLITKNLGVVRAFLYKKFSIWTDLKINGKDNATCVLGEKATLSFLVPFPDTFIKIVEWSRGFERVVVYKVFKDTGYHNITIDINPPIGTHIFGMVAVVKIRNLVLHAWDYAYVNVTYGCDLAIKEVTIPTKLTEGSLASIYIKIVNEGKCSSKQTSLVLLLNGTTIAETTIPALNPNQEVRVKLDFKVPTCAYGVAKLKVIVDPKNIVLESNETNNVYTIITHIAGKFPNIETSVRINKVQVKTPTSFSITLTNTGNDTAKLITLTIKTPPTISVQPLSQKIEELVAKSKKTLTFKLTANKVGTYTIGIIIKYYDKCGKLITKQVNARVTVEKIPTQLTVLAPSKVLINTEFTITVKITPPRFARGLIYLKAPNGTIIPLKDFTTSTEGTYTTKIKLTKGGTWVLIIKIVEEENYKGASKEIPITVFLMRPPSSPSQILASFIVGSLISLAVMLAPVRRAISNAVLYIIKLLKKYGIEPPDWLQEFASIYLEEVFKSYTEKERPPPEQWRLITRAEIIAIIVTALLMSFVLTYVEIGGTISDLSLLAMVLPQVIIASFLVSTMEEFSESFISKLRRYWAEFVIWPHGCISFIISGILFSVPFAAPSRTLFEKDYPEHEKAIVVIHKSFMLLALAGFFGVMTLAGLNVMYDAGLLATLSLLFYTLVPINPLPGYDLYSQNKKAWALIFAIVGLLYIACLLQALHPAVYIIVGAICIALLVISFILKKDIAVEMLDRIK